jgi:hypothetical protein
LQSALILETNCPGAIGSVVTNKIVIICLELLFDTDVVTLPKVLSILFSAEVAPTTSAFTCHQRQPISEATNTAPQVKLVHAFTWEVRALLVDKIPTTSFAVGTFIYNLVSRKGSVLNPAGGHFGDGLGVTFTTFFTGAFFLTGAFFTGAFFVGVAFGFGVTFFVAVAFGVGVGLFVAAVAGVIVSARPRANAIANFLDLIISVDPT